MKILSHAFISDQGYPALRLQTDEGDVWILIEDTKLLFYGHPYVHLGDPYGKTFNVDLLISGQIISMVLENYSNDPEIIQIVTEFRDAVMSGTFPAHFRE